MPYLSQRDPAWAARKLGASTLTVSRYGCTTTCLSMVSAWFGCYKSPSEIAANAANYTKDGLVVWEKLKFDKMRFAGRIRSRPSDAAVMHAVKSPDSAVMLEVDGFHWVVAVKRNLLNTDWIIADPWDGRKKALKSAYKDITGCAYWTRK